jgi:hypothetical protein
VRFETEESIDPLVSFNALNQEPLPGIDGMRRLPFYVVLLQSLFLGIPVTAQQLQSEEQINSSLLGAQPRIWVLKDNQLERQPFVWVAKMIRPQQPLLQLAESKLESRADIK